MVRINFNTSTDAFTNPYSPDAGPAEVARILHTCAERILTTGHFRGPLKDINGNTVGQYEFIPDEPGLEPAPEAPR